MNKDLAQWFRETFINILDYKFGVIESSTDLCSQTKMWRCLGCYAEAMTSYPFWGEPQITHESGCKYLEFMRLLKSEK